MQACEIAVIVTHSHRELRRMLDRLEALVEGMQRNGRADASFYVHSENVKRALLAHMDIEDALIVPLLRAIPTHGRSEAEQLMQHHEAQRRWLSTTLDGKKDVPDAETLRAVQALVHVLRVDMDHEEAALTALAQHAPQPQPASASSRRR